MIKELSDALKVFVNSLSMKPFSTLAAIFLLCTCYVAYRSYDTLQLLIISPSEEAARFKQQLESSALINSSIENLKMDTLAHSVIIKQFHNGRHDLTGIPFTSSTTTFYTSGTNLGSLEEPVSSMNYSLRVMWQKIDNPKCIVFVEPVDASMKHYMETYNLKRVVICPLINLLNYPIGTLTVGFSERDSARLENEDLERTSTVAKRVTGYLENGS